MTWFIYSLNIDGSLGVVLGPRNMMENVTDPIFVCLNSLSFFMTIGSPRRSPFFQSPIKTSSYCALTSKERKQDAKPRWRKTIIGWAMPTVLVSFNPSLIAGSVQCLVFSSIKWDNHSTYLLGLLEKLINSYKAPRMAPNTIIHAPQTLTIRNIITITY